MISIIFSVGVGYIIGVLCMRYFFIKELNMCAEDGVLFFKRFRITIV